MPATSLPFSSILPAGLRTSHVKTPLTISLPNWSKAVAPKRVTSWTPNVIWVGLTTTSVRGPGPTLTPPGRLVSSVPPGPNTVNRTVEDPASVYSWAGFCSVLEAPSPKSHCQAVTGPREVSLNWTVKGALPLETSVEKDATGGGMGVGAGVGVGEGVGVGVGLGVGVGDTVEVATGAIVGSSVGAPPSPPQAAAAVSTRRAIPKKRELRRRVDK